MSEPSYFIQFASNYKNLHQQTQATLLQAKLISFIDLDPALIAYVTEREDGSHRPLTDTCPKMLLTFIGNKHIPFSTVRTIHYKNEFTFYEHTIGTEFSIIIEETE